MKEFIVVDSDGIILERATLVENLTVRGREGTRVVEVQSASQFFIGDKFLDGEILAIDVKGTERNKLIELSRKKFDLLGNVRSKLKTLGFDDEEANLLIGE